MSFLESAMGPFKSFGIIYLFIRGKILNGVYTSCIARGEKLLTARNQKIHKQFAEYNLILTIED